MPLLPIAAPGLRRALLICLIAAAPPGFADIPLEDGRVEGQVVLQVDTADAGAFGLAPGDATTFVARLGIQLDDPPPPGETLPDGDYTGTVSDFALRIGNTMWDETMPHSTPIVRILGGSASAVSVDFTKTMPSHPDFCLFLPEPGGGASERWLALDEVDGVDNGSLEGPYQLEATAAIPILGRPAATLVVAVLALVLGYRRLRRHHA